MTAQKDLPTSRPSTSGQLPRPSLSRPHAHSVSLGSLNPQHRVNRRKSSSAAGVNHAAIAAVAKDASPLLSATPKQEVDALGISSPAGHFTTLDGGVNGQYSTFRANDNTSSTESGSAIVDDGPLLADAVAGSSHSKSSSDKTRARRASEGASRLIKSDKPSAKASQANDLRCETCGKGYKHGSCLTKHLWEHTPQWEVTSKLLISKHQQVQLLEAASVLVAMNQDDPPSSLPTNSSVIRDSELATATSHSPAASGSSDPVEDEEGDDASSRTSTPSQPESTNAVSKPTRFSRPRRQDSYSSVFSRSYQSTSATSFGASSAPNDSSNGFSYYRHWTSQHRPTTSGSSRPGTAFSSDEQADLTAAAESLLSCSLGTPSSGPTRVLGDDVPPVPPLPAKFTSSPIPQPNGRRLASYSYLPANCNRPNGIEATDEEDHDTVMDGMDQHRPPHHAFGSASLLRSQQHFGRPHGRIEEDEGMFGTMDH